MRIVNARREHAPYRIVGRRDTDVASMERHVGTILPESIAALLALLDAGGVAIALYDDEARPVHATAAYRDVASYPALASALATARMEATRLARFAPCAAARGDAIHVRHPDVILHVGSHRILARAIVLEGRRALGVVTVARVENAGPSDESLRERYGLSAREIQVARLIAERQTTPQIATTLGISPHTVRRHRERTFVKLNVHSQREVRTLLRDGRLDSPTLPE